jgi:hypothetical protein
MPRQLREEAREEAHSQDDGRETPARRAEGGWLTEDPTNVSSILRSARALSTRRMMNPATAAPTRMTGSDDMAEPSGESTSSAPQGPVGRRNSIGGSSGTLFHRRWGSRRQGEAVTMVRCDQALLVRKERECNELVKF